MFRLQHHRGIHYLVLLITAALLTLPNLGRPSLWDIDEGVNAEASREMLDSGNYVVPKFNFQLRDAKPALLYWCQIAAYRAFGVCEFSARLPSALAVVVAVLLLYELGRRMFSPLTGLLGGVILSSSGLVCALAHFANPDALLLACTAMTFLAFWRGYAPCLGADTRCGNWFVPVGIACGLGMLAKGPVAVVLPGIVIGLFLIWQRQLWILWDRRYISGAAAFLLVAAPWYMWVTIETRGEFARGFFLHNNLGRFLEPMENHRGPVWYHFAVLPAGLAPWSVFLGPTLLLTARAARRNAAESQSSTPATRCLVCWIAVYLIFFSFSATKLPNYALPVYPAAALLTARLLERWRHGEFRLNAWLMRAGFAILFALGVAVVLGLSFLGGNWSVPGFAGVTFPGVGRWAWIGAIPIAGSVVAWLAANRQQLSVSLCAISVACVAFIAALLAFPPSDIDRYKAVRELVAGAGTRQRDDDIRLASYQYSQPSLVFYSQREVKPLFTEGQVAAFLGHPLPAYLFIPEPAWRAVQERHPHLRQTPVARRWDLYRQCDVLVITNQ